MISNYFEIMKHKLIMQHHHFNITTQSCGAAVSFRVMYEMFIVETNAPHTNKAVKFGIQLLTNVMVYKLKDNEFISFTY